MAFATLQKLSLALQQRFRRQTLHRKREMDLIMVDREQVLQYNKNGADGGLAVLYELIVNTLLKVAPASGKALDIACGPAQLMLRCAQAMPEMHFTGLDLSPRMLQFGADNKALFGVTNADFVSGSMYELNALGRTFDLITWSDAMHHCDNEENVLRVLNQIPTLLNPGGCFMIFDFIRPKTGRVALGLANLYAREYGDWIFQDNLDSYKAAFTYDETEEILAASELKDWRHIQPVVGNAFQFIIVSPTRRARPRQVHTLKYAWQKVDYQFLNLIFAGRL